MRWLWPETVRVLGEVRPAWAIFENPPGLGDVGLAGILSDVENQGYAVRVFSIPACAVGAPHRRERYWIVCKKLADSNETGRKRSDVRERRQETHGLCAEHRQGNMGDAEVTDGRGRREQDGNETGTCGGDDRSMPWGNYIWVPCADGKLRRAISDTQRMAHGLPVELLEKLGTEGRQTPKDCEVHKSILGALGNSIVWSVASAIIAAIVASEK